MNASLEQISCFVQFLILMITVERVEQQTNPVQRFYYASTNLTFKLILEAHIKSLFNVT